jgi:hypothetical protein
VSELRGLVAEERLTLNRLRADCDATRAEHEAVRNIKVLNLGGIESKNLQAESNQSVLADAVDAERVNLKEVQTQVRKHTVQVRRLQSVEKELNSAVHTHTHAYMHVNPSTVSGVSAEKNDLQSTHSQPTASSSPVQPAARATHTHARVLGTVTSTKRGSDAHNTHTRAHTRAQAAELSMLLAQEDDDGVYVNAKEARVSKGGVRVNEGKGDVNPSASASGTSADISVDLLNMTNELSQGMNHLEALSSQLSQMKALPTARERRRRRQRSRSNSSASVDREREGAAAAAAELTAADMLNAQMHSTRNM